MKLDSVRFSKQKSVRGGWFLSYILVLLVPLLLCFLLYIYSAGIITAESKRIYGSALEQARIDLDGYLSEIEQTLSRTMQDQTVQRMVTTKQPLDSYDQLALVNTQSALLTIESGHTNITNVWVALNNLDSVISSRGHLDQHLFYLSRFKNSSLSEDAWRELLHECHPRWEMVQVENEGGTDLLFIRSALTSGLSYADATVVVTVNKQLFVKRLQQFCWDPELNFYVMTPDGTTICKTTEGAPPAIDLVQAAAGGSFAFGTGGQQAYLTRASSVTDWQYVLSISNKLLMKNTRMTQLFTWVGMVFCMVLGLGLSAKLTKRNYQPLGALVSPYDSAVEAPELTEKNEFERLEYYAQKSRRERSDQQHELWKSQQTLRRYYLKSLLESPLGLSRETAERNGIRLDAPFYTVVVFKNPMADNASTGDGSYFTVLQIAIMNIFQEIAEPHFALELTGLGETCVAIVGMQENTPAQDEQLLADIRQTKQQIRAHFHVDPGASVGETHAGAADIRAAYQEALEALSFLRDDGEPVAYHGIHNARTAYTFPLETERKLMDLISLGSEENIAALIRQAFPLDGAVQDPNVARCLAYDITAALIKGAAMAGLDDQKDIRFSPGDAVSPEELQAHLIQISATLCGRVQLLKGSTSTTRALCDRVEQYIKENYADPDLNISRVGQHFDLTPTYLSSQFKKETGVALLAYISNVRVEAAKPLLAKGLSVAKIAEQTGYRDSGSLIRVFKKVTGMTPGQYKAAHSEE
ncbi:MAG: helix-turn-helix domain-containing protein [Gemmiger sp.]